MNESLKQIRTTLADSMVRARMQSDLLEDIERLVARLELACIRQVREAAENAARTERAACAKIAREVADEDDHCTSCGNNSADDVWEAIISRGPL